MDAYISWDITSDSSFDAEGNETHGADYALIEKVWVPVEMRGQGLGKKLIADAIAEIRAIHGDITIRLAALPFGEDPMDIDDLVAYYERMGFSVDENQDGCHAVLMTH